MSMTPSTKPVTRLSSAWVRDKGLRPIVATLHGSLLLLRAKGLRREETLDLAACYDMAVKQRIAREKTEKRKAKKEGT
jgi:hypothetical protein